MDNYNVFIIGGQTKNRTYLSTTWRAAFNVIPDQVNIEKFSYTTRGFLNHSFEKYVRGNLGNDKEWHYNELFNISVYDDFLW